jgi:hypothetical protein
MANQPMTREQRRRAKAQVVAAMNQGQSWQVAVASVGLPISRATAYRGPRRVQLEGETALEDQRCLLAHRVLCLPCQITAATAPSGASRSALWPPCRHGRAAPAREVAQRSFLPIDRHRPRTRVDFKGRSVPCCSASPLCGPGHPCIPPLSFIRVAIMSSPSSGASSRGRAACLTTLAQSVAALREMVAVS